MESFSFNVVERVLERLASHAYQELFLAFDVKYELNKLRETLSTIAKVLLDAEEKQRKDHLLTDWLGKLKDVCYDIDDVLDEFEFQKLRMQVLSLGTGSNTIKGKVRNFFSHRNSFVSSYKMGHRVKDIRERLGEIAAAKAQFNLAERSADWHGMHMERETHSFVHAPDVIGRESEKKEIVVQLFKDTHTGPGDEENVSVISINGLGGLGKTTLAKLVYNDNMVVTNFELRIWVSVSDDFDSKRLLREIVTAATSQKCGDESIEQMQMKLRRALTGKKLLLVLDDVWDKGPMGITVKKWIDLKSLLNVAACGSKVIVTTRNESVALLMGYAHMHLLKVLPLSDCMTIFIKVAFARREEQNHPNLMKIGEDIVKKCGGFPLPCTP
ncbi:putative disease resistance protein RGA3 isoform X2 [Pyrus x bretschneideri]|uniref:putative disease resistance protein RGA3 isoform X2 n=1 Tax=Pyrus x bretschneideri TaxID=225117 RepID=UPI0020308838|nr:putative disease resistance protein RGA3 isoform X2 [Pyrus x bretschneideri]